MSKILEVYNKQKEFFKEGKTLDIEYRLNALKKLKSVIKNNEEEILKALKEDLGKSDFEGYITEVSLIYEEINIALKKLRSWSKNKRAKSPLALFPAKSYVKYEPYGTVLIIGPFNYPFQLNLAPLVGAIAAGNTAMIKPSEYVMATSNIIKKVLEETFDEEYVAYIDPTRGKEVVEELLKMRFDYIFFTGSITVGKIIMKAASEFLTPVTLELGGKSPCIVDSDAKIELAAKRIVWGKLINCGQTCVAPDYIYVHKAVKSKFLEELKKEINKQYGENPKNSEDYGKIVSEREFNRLMSYIEKDNLEFGGNCDLEKLYIEPTILNNITWENKVMKSEIFGPIFPVLEFENLDDVIKEVNDREKPLALYYFSNDKKKIEKVLKCTTSGGMVINDTLMHVSTTYLPFGGVGNSGIGKYHGKNSFYTFSNAKAVVDRGTWYDVPLRYAPFKGKLGLAKKIMK
ncbi:aldehyde dehydrogenase [Clostridium massiliamazoniense]|uniref:aldehyde dehydrogenase n=1 Tax=Clostridium massiliamazoniense TaxID=1347366 RepID=UPI0006D7763C|nr:aldehyde dehydrogenase [Clostridium massiliamazoniense]